MTDIITEDLNRERGKADKAFETLRDRLNDLALLWSSTFTAAELLDTHGTAASPLSWYQATELHASGTDLDDQASVREWIADFELHDATHPETVFAGFTVQASASLNDWCLRQEPTPNELHCSYTGEDGTHYILALDLVYRDVVNFRYFERSKRQWVNTRRPIVEKFDDGEPYPVWEMIMASVDVPGAPCSPFETVLAYLPR